MAKIGTQRKQPEHDHDADWEALLDAFASTFKQHNKGSLFCTNATGLNDIFLAGVGAEKSVHDCYACRRFIENYGGLVIIAEDGHTASAFWDGSAVPAFYAAVVAKMARTVAKARVTGPVISSDKTWGLPKTGAWSHFGVRNPAVYSRLRLTAGQAMAAKREDHHTVARALADFSPAVLNEAARLFESENLQRAEHFLGPIHFLSELHARRAEAKDARLRDNVLWRAIATAPDGFCHPRSSVIGPLLEGIAEGLPFNDIKAKFDAMVQPLRYQRPQAAPRVQNIEQAEKAIEKLGIARSLERRFARLDEIETAWTPAKSRPVKTGGGVFSHLKAKGSPVEQTDAPASTMTWEKFARVVLPGAEAIECHVSGAMNFIALTTAVNEDAPPIMKWGHPVAWYVYPGGSPHSQWGLERGWVTLNAIAPLPTMWGEKPLPHLGEGFVMILDGCVDSKTGSGNALFPECLIADLHGIRATIEAYSRNAQLSGREDGSACGLDIRKGAASLGYRLRVTSCGAATEYLLDRWD